MIHHKDSCTLCGHAVAKWESLDVFFALKNGFLDALVLHSIHACSCTCIAYMHAPVHV